MIKIETFCEKYRNIKKIEPWETWSDENAEAVMENEEEYLECKKRKLTS